MALQPSGEIEFEQDHEDLRRVQPGVADDLVDADRRRAERFDDALRGRCRRGGGVGRKVRRLLEFGGSWIGGTPVSGAMASMMSRASVTRIAPSFSSPLVPAARGSSGEPGTAKTSRPISPASRR